MWLGGKQDKSVFTMSGTKVAGGLPHVCTQAAIGLFGQVKRCETRLNSRHFVNFAAVVLQVGLSEVRPRSWVHRRTYSDWMFPLQWRFACVAHVRVFTCVFTQECGFALYPLSVAFSLIFPQFFSYIIMAVFFSVETETVWSEKPCPSAS